MKFTTPILAMAAALTLAACVSDDGTTPQVAPETPTADAGQIDSPTSLNGTWNLVASECGNANSEGRLAIQGNKFGFSAGECTATNSSVVTNYTSSTLACPSGNRQVNLALQPGRLRLTEDSKTLTYFRCPRV